MTLNEDLATWVATRTDWQKDAIARFCRNEELSVSDVTDIADHLIAGSHRAATGVTAAEIPGSSSPGETVVLTRVSEVSGVNALLDDQVLTFGDRGLTVIYGDNASGKSGYARLIRKAVTARVKSELLGDVFSDDESSQEATIDFAIGARAESWRLGEAQSLALSRVRFYDEECGNAYVTTASEVSYRPSALTILDRLSEACAALQTELETRLAANRESRAQLPVLHAGTTAFRFLDELSANTTAADIDAATLLSDDHRDRLGKQLEEQARLQGSDPTREKARLAALASRWSTIEEYAKKLSQALNETAITALYELCQQATDLRSAAQIAGSSSFDAEPLDGVGSETWRALWEAARRFSEVDAYHDHPFPVVDDGSVCVLCQQPLGAEASERLWRFHKFMTDTTARDADMAEAAVAELRASLVQLLIQPTAVTAALAQLQSDGEATGVVDSWLSHAAEVAANAIAWIDEPKVLRPTSATDSVSSQAGARAKELTEQAHLIDASSFQEALRESAAEVFELQDRLALAEAKDTLVVEVDRLAAMARIEEAKRLTDTTGITRKKGELTETYVTEQVRDHFTRETETLRLRKVTLTRTAGRRDVSPEHRPTLLGSARSTPIESVLSEGEQTALGLAGFLTEVEFDSSKSGVVLDDPVSSLDAGRRSRVAARLVDLATSRQVIVFTHDAAFVTALNKEAREADIEVTRVAVLRLGEVPGKIVEGHPWTAKDTRARIAALGVGLERIKRDRDQLDSDEYTRRVREWAGDLSETWERTLNIEIVNYVVDRGTNEVKPMMFKLLSAITSTDENDFQSGYGKASEWAPRHDNAPDSQWIAPYPDELETELSRLRDWYSRIKSYRN